MRALEVRFPLASIPLDQQKRRARQWSRSEAPVKLVGAVDPMLHLKLIEDLPGRNAVDVPCVVLAVDIRIGQEHEQPVVLRVGNQLVDLGLWVLILEHHFAVAAGDGVLVTDFALWVEDHDNEITMIVASLSTKALGTEGVDIAADSAVIEDPSLAEREGEFLGPEFAIVLAQNVSAGSLALPVGRIDVKTVLL